MVSGAVSDCFQPHDRAAKTAEERKEKTRVVRGVGCKTLPQPKTGGLGASAPQPKLKDFENCLILYKVLSVESIGAFD